VCGVVIVVPLPLASSRSGESVWVSGFARPGGMPWVVGTGVVPVPVVAGVGGVSASLVVAVESVPVLVRDQTQPTLFVDELTLRPWQAADASAVVRAYQDPDIQRWHVRTMSEREAAEWVASWPRKWAEETGAGWAVCDDEGLLARMGLRALSLAEGVGEVAYWVLPEARGRSVAPRALRVVSAWLFVHAGLHRIELAHSTLNTGSCRVAIKAGYALEGTKRQQALHQDGWHDMPPPRSCARCHHIRWFCLMILSGAKIHSSSDRAFGCRS